jgi:hypothetical protein
MVIRHTLMLAAVLLLASRALAEQTEPDQNAIFRAYVNSAVYKKALENIFNTGEPAILKATCPTMKVVASDRVTVLEQPKFVRAGADYNIDAGAWVASAALDRCGSQVTRRALLKAIPGANELKPTFLLPGDFRGNLKLEADAIQIVTPTMMALAKCKDRSKFQMLNITALTPAAASGWSETWSAVACDARVDAEVTYMATGNGMNISAGNWKVH